MSVDDRQSGVAGSAPADEGGATASASRPAASPAAYAVPPARSTAAPIAWLALLLVLVVAAAGFYFFSELQRREATLAARLQGLEATTGRDTTTFDQLRDNLTRQIELELEGIAARQDRAEEDLQRRATRLEAMITEVSERTRREVTESAVSAVTRDVAQRLEPVEEALRQQQLAFADLTIEDRQRWRLAEVQYLLRLANARVVMGRDTQAAALLLRRADDILAALGSASFSALREALAADLAALGAVPDIDVEGLYLRLAALTRQADALVLYEVPREAPEMEAAPPEDWRGRLARGFDAALAKLAEYVVVSRREVPVESLMDPQYEALVRQNLRMLLEQAQLAMLAQQVLPYRQSLERAEAWVSQYFGTGGQAARAMAEELRALREEPVDLSPPALDGSLAALEAVMQTRLPAAGG